MKSRIEVTETYTRPAPVKLDGRLVGHIRKVEGGFQYFPKGKKKGGEIFPSFAACVRSLGDQP